MLQLALLARMNSQPDLTTIPLSLLTYLKNHQLVLQDTQDHLRRWVYTVARLDYHAFSVSWSSHVVRASDLTSPTRPFRA